MNFLIAGLGAIGTVFAAFLKSGGHTVYGLTKQKYLEVSQNKALKVSGIFGERTVYLDGIFANPSSLKSKEIDFVIITVKSFDTEEVVKSLYSFVSPPSIFISAQNGYGNYEIISKYVGPQRTLLARIIFGSKLLNPLEAFVTVIADPVKIGQPEGAIAKDTIINLANIIDAAGIPTAYADNVYQILWDKILYNCALNPLGAILECNYGKLAESPHTRSIMDNIIDEIFETTAINNIKLSWKNSEEYKKHFYSQLIPPTKDHYPSMYYDIKGGKKTEIDSLNGAIVGLAKEMNIRTPINEAITQIIKAKENLYKPTST